MFLGFNFQILRDISGVHSISCRARHLYRVGRQRQSGALWNAQNRKRVRHKSHSDMMMMVTVLPKISMLPR